MSPSSPVPLAPVPLVPVPIPDRIAALIGNCMPLPVMQARHDAREAVVTVSRCRTRFTAEARERALSELHRQNKVLAAYSPRLILTSKRGAA